MRVVALALAVACTLAACTAGDARTVRDHVATPPEDRRWKRVSCQIPHVYAQRVARGVHGARSPDVLFLPKPPNLFGGYWSTTHSGPWPYLQRIPLALYGPGFIRSRGEVSPDREITIADIAPTLAKLLGLRWPNGRAGRPLDEALLPVRARAGVPKLILTVVWDGGGWNVLEQWDGKWPFLARLMKRGTSFPRATVGSSPSVTPAVHATLGSGTFPDRHGIVDIDQRDGNTMDGAFGGRSASRMEVETLADLYDRAVGNQALIGMFAYEFFHMGMIGLGAELPGADRDLLVTSQPRFKNWVKHPARYMSNRRYFYKPSYLLEVPGFAAAIERVDGADGSRDGKWLGRVELDDPSKVRHSPPWVIYQTRLLKSIFRNEGFGRDEVPDLFFTNYKQIDSAGHVWNMLRDQVGGTVAYSDDALKQLVRWLNESVGRRQWVLVVTADHGQAPLPSLAENDAWAIRISYLKHDIAVHFGVEVEDLFLGERPIGFWLNRKTMRSNDITQKEIAQFLIEYRLGENVPDMDELPATYEDDLDDYLFAAAFPRRELREIERCTKR